MVSRIAKDRPSRPDVGDILIVIHDFVIRSSDELDLKKGDRVELLERDDQFGDGWFLGRHIANNNTGLFPEVYTRPISRVVTNSTSTPASIATQKPLAHLVEATQESAPQNIANTFASAGTSTLSIPSSATPSALPIQLLNDESALAPSLDDRKTPASVLEGQMRTTGQDEVPNETPNAIDEHIISLQLPPGTTAIKAAATDSGTEHRVEVDLRISCAQGEETDEGDEITETSGYTLAKAEAWSPDDVAKHLFTKGVEKHHCEIFRDQEISGEVLLSMDQTSLLIKNLDLGSVGRRLRTWQKIKTLQDEISGEELGVKRVTNPRLIGDRSQAAKRMRNRTSTVIWICIS
ncbi:hypothetical protein GGI35DRAFT_205472 [Trichoderma velutinum]